MLRGVEGDHSAPLQASALDGSRVAGDGRAQRLDGDVDILARSSSWPHERRSVPSGAVPSERCAAGEQCRPARVITPQSSSISRATVAHGHALDVEREDADALGRVVGAVERQAVDRRERVAEPAPERRRGAPRRGRYRRPAGTRRQLRARRFPIAFKRAALVAVGCEVRLHLELGLAARAAADQRLDLDARVRGRAARCPSGRAGPCVPASRPPTRRAARTRAGMWPALWEASTTKGTPCVGRDRRQRGDGEANPRDVRCVGRDREARAAAAEPLGPLVEVESRRCSRRRGRPRSRNDRCCSRCAQRAHDRVVLERARHDPPAVDGEAADRQVERLGRVLGEDEVVGRPGPEQIGEALPRQADRTRGGDRAPVTRAARVAAGVREEVLDRREDGRRLGPRGRRVVEVDVPAQVQTTHEPMCGEIQLV